MQTPDNHTILVVDDDQLNRLFLVDLLKIHNIHVIEAATGKEAVQLWSDHDFSVILMDINMPEMDGIEATKRIRHLETAEGKTKTPIIALTAYATYDNQNECKKAGMDHFIAKPIRIPDLLDVIRHLL